MLTNLHLDFKDKEMKLPYVRKHRKYYAKAVMVITALLLLITVATEVILMSQSDEEDDQHFKNPLTVRLINVAFLIIFVSLNFVIRREKVTPLMVGVIKAISPTLTVYLYLVISLGGIISDKNETILFFIGMISTASAYFILVMFNDSWLFNLGFFTPCLCLNMAAIGD